MTGQEMIVDRWREVPAISENGFRGMTELSKGGRCVQICSVGPEARELLVRHVEATLAAEATSVVVGDDRIGFVDQGLDGGDRRVVLEPDQSSAGTACGTIEPNFVKGDRDHPAASGAIGVDNNVVEISAGHRPTISEADESDQRA